MSEKRTQNSIKIGEQNPSLLPARKRAWMMHFFAIALSVSSDITCQDGLLEDCELLTFCRLLPMSNDCRELLVHVCARTQQRQMHSSIYKKLLAARWLPRFRIARVAAAESRFIPVVFLNSLPLHPHASRSFLALLFHSFTPPCDVASCRELWTPSVMLSA